MEAATSDEPGQSLELVRRLIPVNSAKLSALADADPADEFCRKTGESRDSFYDLRGKTGLHGVLTSKGQHALNLARWARRVYDERSTADTRTDQS